jgi:ATP-binding cassette subfamily B multidrug efflux pump
MVLEVAMDLMQPKLMSHIIDGGVAAGDSSAIFQYGIRMLVCALVGLLAGYLSMLCSNYAGFSWGLQLRRTLFRHIQQFSFAETDKFTTGSLVTRLTSDIGMIQHGISMVTRMLFRSPFLLMGSIYLVLTTNPKISIPLLAAAPILSGLVIWRIRVVRPLYRRIQERLDDVNTVMQENLTGIRVVKAFASEPYERERFDDANERLTETSVRTGKIMVALGPWLSFVQYLTVIAIVFIAARDINLKLIQIGEVAAIINYATQVMMSLIMLSHQIMHLSRAAVSVRRIDEVFETEPSIVDGSIDESPENGSVEIRGVSFKYPAAVGDPVLKNISLHIKDGEHLAIMGATGSGKTSLVNLLPRFYDPTEGAILIGDRDIREYTLEALRYSMGIVMQETRLFFGTIAENIRWGDEYATDDEVEHYARIAGAHDFIMSFPEGYNTSMAQGGVTLSGGQKQRISIARALLRRPQILILDDSTSAVDVLTETRIQEALRKEMRGMTVIKIAQRISSVMDADRIVVLEDGAITGIGSHEELLSTNATYREICDSQDSLREISDAS